MQVLPKRAFPLPYSAAPLPTGTDCLKRAMPLPNPTIFLGAVTTANGLVYA